MRDSPTSALAIAWSGMAVFAISLLWGCYCYLARFDAPAAAAGVAAPLAMNVALFSLFALHHSVLARTGVKAWVERHLPDRLERSSYTWIASLLFIAVCTLWQPVPGVLYRLDGVARLAGYAIQIVGVVLTIRASRALDVLDLAGVRQVQTPANHTPSGPPQLQTTGLYGFVRHPLYFAWTLMVFGTPDMTATRAAFACISTAYLAVAIPWEERSLIHVFGPAYAAYRRAVRWRMLPGIY